MLYMVEMIVNIPHTLSPEVADEIKRKEKAYSQELQRAGKWRHLWRVVGEYANVSIFDVASNDELHTLLSGLPLFPYMQIQVTPLANHPSSIVQE
jgi:muconolactone D-isomerase